MGAALLWLMVGCGGVSTTINWNESYTFADLGTYEWIERAPPPGIDSITVREIVGTADALLQEKGYEKDSEDPSFLVAYHFGLRKEDVDRQYSNPYIRTTYKEEVAKSQLIIEVIDPRAQAAVWSGSAAITADPTDTHKNASLIRKGVRELLAGFPPESESP